jgi:RND family efflux transporter MFP subunit
MNRSCARTLAGLLAVAALATAGCGRRKEAAAAETARTLAVRTEEVQPKTFERRLSVQGTLDTKSYAHVAARVEGNLDAIWVDEGDTVVAGETALFQVDPTPREHALTIARQNLAVTQASLTVVRALAEKARVEARKAALDLARYERLHRDGRVTDNEFEAADVANAQALAGSAVAAAQVDLAERQVKQGEAALAIAQKALDDTKVIAPLSGTVSSRTAEPGEYMSVGRVVLRIDDLASVEAAAYLPAQYYPEVQPGKTQFRLGIAARDAGVHTVTYRSPTVNPVLRTFEIKGRVANAGTLAVPGSMAELTLVFETRAALGVPSAAVLIRAGRPVVFIVQDGRAVGREVRTGLQNDGWTEIVSGLAAGELVVTEGQTQLRDGMPVTAL